MGGVPRRRRNNAVCWAERVGTAARRQFAFPATPENTYGKEDCWRRSGPVTNRPWHFPADVPVAR